MRHTDRARRTRTWLAALALLLALAALAAPTVAQADSPDPTVAADSSLNLRVRMSAVHWLSLLAGLLLIGAGSAVALGKHSTP